MSNLNDQGSGFRPVTVERVIDGKRISLETGRFAKQAHGAVVIRLGDTMNLVTVVIAPPREGADFFPLTVDYREKTYAAGKFPGGFIKREGRPSTKEVLTCRLADRPLRPLFPDGYFDEVQIQASPISADRINDPDILTITGSSAALSISPAPFLGPIGAVRLGRINGDFVAFPTVEQMATSDLDLIVASSSEAVTMIEGFAQEIIESDMHEAIMHAHAINQELIALQKDLMDELKISPISFEKPGDPPAYAPMYDKFASMLREAKQVSGKAERAAACKEVQEKAIAELCPDPESAEAAKEGALTPADVKSAFYLLEKRIVRQMILDGFRVDGRSPQDLREITCEVGVLPKAHGSAIFQRGETQALVTTVLGTGADEQRVEGIMGEVSKKFMLDYNMPPFAVGEVRPIRGPGRREIGHGALAERSVAPVLPSVSEFPYTIRVISDILESNGSSSMASVCGATLSLMHAGVPISDPVGGISIGLILDKENGRHILLTDIVGEEDHFGDMDFKVAGTQYGVTGIQLDLKIDGISSEIIRETLDQAADARRVIFQHMLKTIRRPNEEISQNAPRLIQLQINSEKVGLVIGPGGKTIRRLEEETGAKIEIDGTSGIVTISSPTAEGAIAARDQIEGMTQGVQVGKVYEGRVTTIKEGLGAFVEIMPGRDGLVHISELSEGYVNSVSEICRVGDTMIVKVINVDEQDRVKLSRRAAMADSQDNDPGDNPSSPPAPPAGNGGAAPRRGGGSGGGGGNRGRRR